MDILVLHNQSAGDEEPTPGRLLALLRREGYTPQYFELHAALDHPDELPEMDFVVVAGGDGSFRKTALTLGDRCGPIALLPLGTANNVARSLGIRGGVAEVIAEWDHSKPRHFNLGVVRGPWGERRFVEGVGLGLFARVIDILDRIETAEAHASAERPHRVASDLRSTTVLAHELAPLSVDALLDGERAAGDWLLFEALNIGRVGAAVELAPEADVSDGYFDVSIAELADRGRLLETLGNVAKEVGSPSTLGTRRCRRIELLAPPGPLRVDDEIITLTEATRIEIEIASEGIEVLMPARDKASGS